MSEFRRRLMAVKKIELQEDELLGIYNVTSTSSPTRLLGAQYQISFVEKMYIDDVEITPTLTYTFGTIGEHSVKIKIVSSAYNMNRMFYACANVKELDLSKLDISHIYQTNYTFQACSAETINMSNWDTSNVISMVCMFRGCGAIELDLSHFNTSNVTNMNQMFYSCIYLKRLDISNFNTDKVTIMSEMFYRCEQIESLDLSSFNTTKVAKMPNMFNQCKKLKSLDLSNFYVQNVTDMSGMFSACSLLTIFEPFNQWAKAAELSLSDSIITPFAVHKLIERASGAEDGAIARTLILNATTKTNWQNSEYYEADQVMAIEKLITIQ